MTFGSTDNNSATISSSPADVPPIRTGIIGSFGSVPAVNGGGESSLSFWNQQAAPLSLKQSSSTSNPPTLISPTATKSIGYSFSELESFTSKPDAPAPSSIPVLKHTKLDIRKFFQNPPSSPSAIPSTSDATAQLSPPPSSRNPRNNTSSFNPGVGFQPTPSNGPPPSTSGIQPVMSSTRLSAPPHSTHPGPPPTGFPPHQRYGYYVSGIFPIPLPGERLILNLFRHPVSSVYAPRPGVHVPSPMDVTDFTPR